MERDQVVYRPTGYVRASSLPPVSEVRKATFTQQVANGKQGEQFSFVWLLVSGLIVAGITFGAIAGYVRFFQPDNVYTERFGALAAEDALIQTLIDSEAAARAAADMSIMGLQSALGTDIEQEIATRTAQDMLLMQMLAQEVAEREAAQRMLRQLLSDEIQIRETTDNQTDYQLSDLERRLIVLRDYDVYALQQFMIKMDNLTHIQERLDTEIAERIASDMILMSQDSMQQAQIATISMDLANEIATRTAADLSHMMQIAPFLTGLFSINHQMGTNNNFNLVSDSTCGVSVGSGGTNVITLNANFIRTLGGMTPDATTRNIGLVAGQNFVITPNVPGHSLSFGLIAVPIPANELNFAGVIGNPTPFVFPVPAGQNWHFDFDWTGPTGIISNFPTYNGLGWEIPAGPGTYIVRMKLRMAFTVQSLPDGVPIQFGTCIGTHAYCLANPSDCTATKSYRWSSSQASYTGSYLALRGLQTNDATTEMTLVMQGNVYPTTTGVYPVWRYTDTFGTNGAPQTYLISVEYHITKLH